MQIGRVVQYRLTAVNADAWSAHPGVARRYLAGEILPAIVVTARPSGRCDLQVFLHGPGTAFLAGVPEHYAAEGSWTRPTG